MTDGWFRRYAVGAFGASLLAAASAAAAKLLLALGVADILNPASNVAVNGAIDVSQELGVTGATLANNTARYTADCFEGFYNHGAATAVVTSGQVAAASFGAALSGFSFGHRLRATTAISAIANGDHARHRSKIEGYRIAKWGWGAAGAKAIVVAFQFYSTVSGTAFVKLSNNDQSRCLYHEITVAAGWNFYSFALPGDTAGTWQATTSTGLTFELFAAGKSATQEAVFDVWSANNRTQTTNNTNLLATNNNETVLTGLYIAAGTVLPAAADLPQLMRSADVETVLCKRYTNRLNVPSGAFAMLQCFSATAAFGVLWTYDVALRGVAPAGTISDPTHMGLGDAAGSGAVACTGVVLSATARYLVTGSASGSSGLVAGNATQAVSKNAALSFVVTDRL